MINFEAKDSAKRALLASIDTLMEISLSIIEDTDNPDKKICLAFPAAILADSVMSNEDEHVVRGHLIEALDEIEMIYGYEKLKQWLNLWHELRAKQFESPNS